MSRRLTMLAFAALSMSAIPAFAPTETVADGDAKCSRWSVDRFSGELICVARVTETAENEEPNPGRSGETPEPGGEEPGDDEDAWAGDPWDGDADEELNEDSVVEGLGGGSGEPPPSCRYVPRPGLVRSRMVNTVDDTGLSGGFVYERICDDGSREIVERPTDGVVRAPAPGEPPAPPPPPDPEDLARELYGEMIVRLPTPTVRVAPAETDSHGWAYVQNPAFFWIDEWSGMSASLSVGSVSVTLTVEPSRLDIDTGDGKFTSCSNAPPFPEGADPLSFDGCEYVYRHSSAMADNGESYPVEATMVWTATWTSNVGAGGSLGELQTVGTRDLQVAEVQAILVEG